MVAFDRGEIIPTQDITPCYCSPNVLASINELVIVAKTHVKHPVFTWLLGGERHRKFQLSKTFLERTRKGHRQHDQHWNCFKGNISWNSRETGWSAHGLSLAHRYPTELNWMERNRCSQPTYSTCLSAKDFVLSVQRVSRNSLKDRLS